MILQRILRQQSLLRAVSSSTESILPRSQARGIHRVPQLTHNSAFKKDGIAELMSPDGFDLSWTQYQTMMVDKLNLLTGGTPDENATPATLLIKYSRQASMASLFNYASMAHNNHFFFNCLSPAPVEIPQNLEKEITESCSSVESLRAEFLATANAMFGPGFVWLVRTNNGNLKILTTYIAGSPYPAAHFRRQPVDMATETTGVTGGENADALSKLRATNRVGSMGQFSGARVLPPGGVDVHPILCVNTWEHVYIRDWGVGGKTGFLEAWWDKINWEEVAQNFQQGGGKSTMRSSTRSARMDKYLS
ncbi:hypothetical protein FQN54_003804 [Arachnomyces sp. PD_36]|nr:hypothetical protein FQN54_003804 [Arachnomyces sp. PD_36]